MSLTAEDKQWFTGQLDQLTAGFDGKLERLATVVDAELKRLETSFDAKLERVETTLLTEFQKWASPHEARIRTHSATLRAVDLELEAVSDRVTKLEAQPPH
jgi:hypothetical protein